MAIFRVTLGSNQGSDHNTIFIYLISSFQTKCQNLKSSFGEEFIFHLTQDIDVDKKLAST